MLLETDNLTIGYGKKIIQQSLNIRAAKGSLISLVGTNGAGKSTLLRTISGLQKALGGSIKIGGTNINEISAYNKAKLLALVLTDKIDVENMTVRQLVAMGRFPYTNWLGKLSDADANIINAAIENVNLSHKANDNINHISDGEKQRAVIAKALAQDTPLVLLDEPTAHLDLPNRIETVLLLRRLSVQTGKTFIISTHELEVALQTSDQIWLMTKDGIKTGIPEDLMLTREFQNAFGSANYTFDSIDGHCIIKHLFGNLTVRVISELNSQAQTAWLTRALMRVGIIISDDAGISITCTHEGYKLTYSKNSNDGNDILYSKIEDLLSAINQLS